MKPATITLSDPMRARLDAALQPFEDAYPYSRWQSAGHWRGQNRGYHGSISDNKLTPTIKLGLSKAVASAILPSPESMPREAYETLAREHPEIIEESLRISDALLGMADGSTNPAVMLENLPTEGRGFYFLAGMQQLLGDVPDTPYRNERTDWYSFSTKQHAMQHRDSINVSSGNKGTIHLRGMMGRAEGGKPWPTVITSAEEILASMASAMLRDTGEPVDAETIRQKSAQIAARFAQPIWTTPENRTAEPALLGTPSEGEGVGYYFNFNHQGLSLAPQASAQLDKQERAECHQLVEYFHQARRDASALDGTHIRPGSLLLWNNLTVFHGAGLPENGKDGLCLPPRQLDHLEIFHHRESHIEQEVFGPFTSGLLIREDKDRPARVCVDAAIEELAQMAQGKTKKNVRA